MIGPRQASGINSGCFWSHVASDAIPKRIVTTKEPISLPTLYGKILENFPGKVHS